MRRFKLPKLRHPWAKSAAGFTLVELIVVIAIMGVLAGVGTVGYSGYVKSSKKGADKTLIGNVMRAIETGTNSYAFVGDDSFKMGTLSYPVGFVVLTDDGAQVITSNTEMVPALGGECDLETVTVAIVKGEEKTIKCTNIIDLGRLGTYGCPDKKTNTFYTIQENVTITYCKNHSTNQNAIPAALTEATTYRTNVNFECTYDRGESDKWKHVWADDTTKTLEAGTLVTNGETSGFYKLKAEGMCEAAYANQYGTFAGENKIENATSGEPIYDSLIAAFGSLDNIKLTYNGWKSDEGVSYATFYTAAPDLMEDIERLSGLLVVACWGGDTAVETLGLTQKYNSSEEVLSAVSENIATNCTEAQWMEAWELAADETWNSWGFNLAGRENYSAARMSYNNAFASYLETTDSRFAEDGIYSGYLTNIREFYSQELLGVGLPGLVNTSAFTDSESPLKSKINNDEVFNLMASKYETYKDSEACKENGRLVYDVMLSFDETSDVANAYADTQNDDYNIYDYYTSYVNEMAALYEAAQTAAGDGIVIIVSVENGVVTCDVSPSVANPRED